MKPLHQLEARSGSGAFSKAVQVFIEAAREAEGKKENAGGETTELSSLFSIYRPLLRRARVQVLQQALHGAAQRAPTCSARPSAGCEPGSADLMCCE